MRQRHKKTNSRLAWRSQRYFKASSPPASQSTSTGSSQSRRGGGGQSTPGSPWIWRLVSLAFLIVAVGLVINWSLVRASRVDVAATDQSQQAVADLLAGQIEQFYQTEIGLSFKPLLSKQAITDQVTTSFPQLYQIEVQIPVFASHISVSARLRQPLAHSFINDNPKQVALIDQDGQSFISKDDSTTITTSLPRLIDTSPLGESDSRGGEGQAAATTVYPAGVITFIYDLNKILLEQKLTKAPIIVEIGSETRQIIWRPAGVSYGVKFNTARDPLDQAKEYEAMGQYLKRRGVTPRSYIDLRVDDTAYYR